MCDVGTHAWCNIYDLSSLFFLEFLQVCVFLYKSSQGRRPSAGQYYFLSLNLTWTFFHCLWVYNVFDFSLWLCHPHELDVLHITQSDALSLICVRCWDSTLVQIFMMWCAFVSVWVLVQKQPGEMGPPWQYYFLYFLILFHLFLLLVGFYSWYAAICECRDINKNRLLNRTEVKTIYDHSTRRITKTKSLEVMGDTTGSSAAGQARTR